VQGRDCWRRVIDLSGDGMSNSGPAPDEIGAALEGVIVNGLVIGTQELDFGGTRDQNAGELALYYRREVMRGPGAFVLIALGYEDYARAMEAKLLRELGSLPAAGLAPGGAGRRPATGLDFAGQRDPAGAPGASEEKDG
jgi:hypothetical protein